MNKAQSDALQKLEELTGKTHQMLKVTIFGSKVTVVLDKMVQGIVDKEFKDNITKEMGDVQWYMARLCDQFDIPFEDVFTTNIEKLQSRKKRNNLHGDGDER